MTPASKTCTKCGQLKALDEFTTQRRAKDGKHSWCRACMNAKAKEWNERRRAEIGDEAWKAERREAVQRHRDRTGDAYNIAKRAALRRLAEAYRAEYERLLTEERARQETTP